MTSATVSGSAGEVDCKKVEGRRALSFRSLDEAFADAEALVDAFAVATAHLEQAPKLIPLCGHRYIPAEPCEAGNPVFSIYQTDIICYGADLWQYLSNEYMQFLRGPDAHFYVSSSKEIPFWSWLVDLNCAA